MAANYLDRQASFSGGEVSSETYGRTDSPTFKSALKLSLNGFPKRHGAWTNRAGTTFVAKSKTDPAGGIAPRLIRFRFSDSQAFAIELGDRYCRFYQNGGPVLVSGVAAYSAAVTYQPGALVVIGGVNYYCTATTHGHAPPNAAFWYPLSGSIYEIPTPWAIADVWRLKYAQSGDVITLTHPSYAPSDVDRLGNTDLVITPTALAPPAWPFAKLTSPSFPFISLGGGAIIPYDSSASYAYGQRVYTQDLIPGIKTDTFLAQYILTAAVLVQPPVSEPEGISGPLAAPSTVWALDSWDSTRTYAINQYVWRSNSDVPGMGEYGILCQCIQVNTNQDPRIDIFGGSGGIGTYWQIAADVPGKTTVAANGAHPPSQVSYAVTADLQDSHGVIVESLPAYYSPIGGVFPRFADRPLALVFNTAPVSGYVLKGFNIYVGANGLYGFVDSVTSGVSYWIDSGAAPDFNTNPPAGTNPFIVGTSSGISVFSYPGVVAYFQQRRLFARSNANPNTLWGSAEGNFLNFDRPTFITDSDSYLFPVASTDECEIRSITPQRELFVMSSSAEFVASGSNGGVGGAITPSSIDIRSSSNHGISYLDPIPIDREVLDVTAKGNYVRKLMYDWRSANYIGSDISSLVRHLLDGYTIVDWFFAETPDSLVYIVRSDGALLTLTYDPAFEVVAWSQHATNNQVPANGGGSFCSVTSVPEGTEDAVYYVVLRTINGAPAYYIERQSSRFVKGPNGIGDYRQANFLDCSLSYNGRNTVTTAIAAVALPGALPAAQQYIVTIAGGAPFVQADADKNNVFVLNPDGVPQPNDINGEAVAPLPPLRMVIVGFTSASVVTCELNGTAPADWAPYNNTSKWAIARSTFAGLDYLNGQVVAALVDGSVESAQNTDGSIAQGKTVQAGSVTLQNAGVDVTIGLPYNSDLQLLDLALDTAKTNVKAVEKVSLELSNSRAFLSGEDFENLSPSDQRALTDGYNFAALQTGMVICPTSSTWNISGSMCVRNADPTPLTIVAAIREVVIGGRG